MAENYNDKKIKLNNIIYCCTVFLTYKFNYILFTLNYGIIYKIIYYYFFAAQNVVQFPLNKFKYIIILNYPIPL